MGTESAWRLANNTSIEQAAKAFNIDLTVIDADNVQDRQIEAIYSFIEQKVDVIVLSPLISTGWDAPLQAAKVASIPVLLSDRSIDISDEDMYLTFIGADFIEEGRRAMRWIAANMPPKDRAIRILELQGTGGATPTIQRKRGFEEMRAKIPGYEIVYSEIGDFTYDGGKGIVEEYLRIFGWDIDVIFSHNDDMALGAIEALEAAGFKPGTETKIVSVDGTKQALHAIIDGKLNCSVECSPLLGPQLMKAIQDLMSGKELPLRIITDEIVFTQENAEHVLKERNY